MFNDIYKTRTILVTGQTGFKGSWLALWLNSLGANVVGYSLPPPTQPNHFELANIAQKITHYTADIRDLDTLEGVMRTHQPSMIFHLAAQSLVLASYQSPKETFDTNAGGTVNVLEAARRVGGVEALVMITSDKCYANQEWCWGYRESDL